MNLEPKNRTKILILLASHYHKNLIEIIQKYREMIPEFSSFTTPLHITLLPPFEIPDSQEEVFINRLKECTDKCIASQITLDTVGYFNNRKSVAYIKPDEKSVEYLKNVFTQLSNSLNTHIKLRFAESISSEDYRPHVTIAKKIERKKLANIKSTLDTFKETLAFNPETIDLYKQVQGWGVWKKVTEARMNPTLH